MRPMLATRGEVVPTGGSWTHEVKWDGMRVLADARGAGADALRLTSRNENAVTIGFPELGGLAAYAGRDLLLDGEVVAFTDGVPSFGALADRMHVVRAARALALSRSNPVSYLVFDLLRLDGRDLTAEPLQRRREELLGLGLLDVAWHVPEAYADGDMLMQATRQQGLEGVVSKRLTSRYEPGQRSSHWLKFPHRVRGSFVVGGWRPEKESSHRLGALLVGEPTPEGLRFCGRVGSGIAGARGPALSALLEPLAQGASPFCDEVPRIDALGTHWVRPELVVEVESLGRSRHDRLRQPSYQGLRADLTPEDLEL